MHVGEICTKTVVTCHRDANVLDVARLMCERHVGAVVVVDDVPGGVTPVGVLTDRYLVVEVMAQGRDPRTTRVSELLLGDLETVFDSELTFDAVWHMRRHGIRRLPVVDSQGRLQGILCADDVVNVLAQQLTALAGLVHGQAERETLRDDFFKKASGAVAERESAATTAT